MFSLLSAFTLLRSRWLWRLLPLVFVAALVGWAYLALTGSYRAEIKRLGVELKTAQAEVETARAEAEQQLAAEREAAQRLAKSVQRIDRVQHVCLDQRLPKELLD